jgi:hypothetical protein
MKDRELVIIGAGAFLTVLCLLFSWPFAIRVVVGVAVLIFFTSFALWPVGPERLTIEEALLRYVRKARRPKKYALTDERQDQVAPRRGEVISAPPPEARVAAQPSSDSTPAEKPAATRVTDSNDLEYEAGRPFVGEVDFSRVMMIWLGVIGVYFIYWLFQGGSREIGEWMKTLLP